MTSRFDPSRSVVFDFDKGSFLDDEGEARLNLPLSLVLRLAESGGAAQLVDFGRSLGSEVGRKLQAKLGAGLSSASLETWTEHLGGHFALIGLGQLSLERWGRALVFRVHHAPKGSEALAAGALEGALQRGLGRTVSLISFDEGQSVAFLALSSQTADRMRPARDEGKSLGTVVSELHAGLESRGGAS